MSILFCPPYRWCMQVACRSYGRHHTLAVHMTRIVELDGQPQYSIADPLETVMTGKWQVILDIGLFGLGCVAMVAGISM